MSDIAIRVENLSKLYHIGKAQKRHDTLRDAIVGAFNVPTFSRSNDELLWALKDVSFEVKRGEVVGIIGRNGAGKSTLLKILSRITEPTKGRVIMDGRVGSLLEVGTGFHPELTGRENIYLNGAILGMKKAEIERKFDEIVAFSEIEKFLDTPVKHYSSGMYVRLAFAVAAHLEPEILMVDEVLAVGDAAFQKKCLGKMGDVAKEGRTVLFVSHNMAAIEHLSNKGVVLNNGKLVLIGTSQDAVAYYEDSFLSEKKREESLPAHVIFQKPIDGPISDFDIVQIELLDLDNQPKLQVYTWDTVKFRIHYFARQSINAGSLALLLSSRHGIPLLLLSTQPDSTISMRIQSGYHYVDCQLEQLPLSAGDYIVGSGLAVPNKEWLCRDESLAILTVRARDVYQSGLAPISSRSLLAIPHTWRVP